MSTVLVKLNVRPISCMEEALMKCHFTNNVHELSRLISLPWIEMPKRVFIVSFNEPLEEQEYIIRLWNIHLKPCSHAPNYLFGIFRAFPECLPELLKEKEIVAAEPHFSSTFRYGGHDCFLMAYHDAIARGLDFLKVSGLKASRRAFLAEDI